MRVSPWHPWLLARPGQAVAVGQAAGAWEQQGRDVTVAVGPGEAFPALQAAALLQCRLHFGVLLHPSAVGGLQHYSPWQQS